MRSDLLTMLRELPFAPNPVFQALQEGYRDAMEH
jgi:hypothetical protein